MSGERPPTLPSIHDARAAWRPGDTPLPPIDQLVSPAHLPPRFPPPPPPGAPGASLTLPPLRPPPMPAAPSAPPPPSAPSAPPAHWHAPVPPYSPPSVLSAPPAPPPFGSADDGWDSPYVPNRGKRKRSQRSCVACHKSKRRCDRRVPCTNCLYNGKVCQYFDELGQLSAPAPFPDWPLATNDNRDRDRDRDRDRIQPPSRSLSTGDVRPLPHRSTQDAPALAILAEAAAGPPARPQQHALSDSGSPPSVLSPPLSGPSGPATTIVSPAHPAPSASVPSITDTPHVSSPWVSTLPPSPKAAIPSLSSGWELGPGRDVAGPRRARWAPSPDLPLSASAAPRIPNPALALPPSVPPPGPVPVQPAAAPAGPDGLWSSVATTAKASLPTRELQREYVTLFQQVGFPLNVCLPALPPTEGRYAYRASHALLHAIYAFVAPPAPAGANAQAARALLALNASDEEDKEGAGGGVSGGVPMAYTLLAMRSLQLGMARQATLDAALAWRTLDAVSSPRLCAVVAVVEGLASLYAGVRPTAQPVEGGTDELAKALAYLAKATRLTTCAEVDTWSRSLPPSLAYTGEHVAAIAEAGAQGGRPSPDQLAWVSMHLLAARVQLCSPRLSASAIGRGRVATLQAAIEVNSTWSRAVGAFLLLARAALTRPTEAQVQDGPTRMALAVLDRPVPSPSPSSSPSPGPSPTTAPAPATGEAAPPPAIAIAEAGRSARPGRSVTDLLAALPRRRTKILPPLHAKAYASTRP